MLQRYLSILVILNTAKLHQALQHCSDSTYSVYGHSLSSHVISTRISSSLSDCVMMCRNEFRCKSLNFRLMDKSCDLNDGDRYTHPEDFGPQEGSVYMDTSLKHKKVGAFIGLLTRLIIIIIVTLVIIKGFAMHPMWLTLKICAQDTVFLQEGGFKSCAEIHKEFPKTESGYYWVNIGNREAQVYCDMKNYGGGWTLVVSISSKNNDHLQRTSNNCLNSILCVRFAENSIEGRKLSDQDIHKLAQTEGTFRVDVLDTQVIVFYQIPSGPKQFNSSCARGNCPPIIISHSYPYKWETNNCTTTDVGYNISSGCYRVFDGHDDGKCGHGVLWRSSNYSQRRALYGYPCPEDPPNNSHGIYRNSDGMLYVK